MSEKGTKMAGNFTEYTGGIGTYRVWQKCTSKKLTKNFLLHYNQPEHTGKHAKKF